MNTPKFPTDELFEVERRIARRADELTRQYGFDPAHALDNWRKAEDEVWHEAHGEDGRAELAATAHG